MCKVKSNQQQKINKPGKAKASESDFKSSSRTFQNASLPPAPPPPPPPYVPSLQSMPSLPNSSLSASFGAIDSNTTNSAHQFISHLISSSHNILIGIFHISFFSHGINPKVFKKKSFKYIPGSLIFTR